MNTPERLRDLAVRFAANGWVEASAITPKKFNFKFTKEGVERISLLAELLHDLEGLTPDEAVTLVVFCEQLLADAKGE
ncbi:MAG: hypothetical protein P4N60_19255 [Verrucomicrobiae bacterium]|nr:hypothetical protein [Verrucomicrobiae bacterium]